MDNAQKAIMIGVGLFITIIIIAAVMLITGMGQDLLNQGTSQLSNVSSQLQQQLTSKFDNVQMSGSQVLSAINTYYSDSTMVIAVNNTKTAITTVPSGANIVWGSPNKAEDEAFKLENSRFTTTKGITQNTTQPALGSFSSATADQKTRIVTTGQYQARLIDLNGSVLGIYFSRI